MGQVVSAARERRCGFKYFLSKVRQRLLLTQHQIERVVSMFGPEQSYFSDEFLFVRSYQRPVGVEAFVQYC